jgi:excisionase family DNA binding protein
MTSNGTLRDLFEPVLTLAELADYLQVPVQTLYDLRVKGGGPRGFRVGRCLHFRKSEIEAWLAALEDEEAVRDHSRDAS